MPETENESQSAYILNFLINLSRGCIIEKYDQTPSAIRLVWSARFSHPLEPGNNLWGLRITSTPSNN